MTMRILPRPEKVPMIGGLFVSAHRRSPQGEPQARGRLRPLRRNKATEFILANPQAGAKVLPRHVSRDRAARRERRKRP